MRLAFISILRWLEGPQFDFLVIFAVRLRFFVNFNFRVLRGFYFLSRRHRPNSGIPLSTRKAWTMCGWNSKGSSQLLDLHFQFLIQRSSVLLTDPPCRYLALPMKYREQQHPFGAPEAALLPQRHPGCHLMTEKILKLQLRFR